MQNDTQKIKDLFLSGDEANFELALTLVKSQKNAEINEFYRRLLDLHECWSKQILDDYPKELSGMIPYFKEQGLNFFKNYELREFPADCAIIAPFVKSLYIWYLSLHSLPTGIEMFQEIESIKVNSGKLSSLAKEAWALPKLKRLDICIAKNFEWNENILLAQGLESIDLSGVVYPSIPAQLDQLPNLKRFGYRALGNPKDEVELEEVLWNCTKLETLDLYGKTIVNPEEHCFEKMTVLKSLSLASVNWEELPKSLLAPKQLNTLLLNKLIKLKTLPDWFASLPIEHLIIYGCKFSNAMDIFQQLPNLKSLSIQASLQKKVTAGDWQQAFGHVQLFVR